MKNNETVRKLWEKYTTSSFFDDAAANNARAFVNACFPDPVEGKNEELFLGVGRVTATFRRSEDGKLRYVCMSRAPVVADFTNCVNRGGYPPEVYDRSRPENMTDRDLLEGIFRMLKEKETKE